MKSRPLWLAAAAAVLAIAGAVLAAPVYTIIDLGTLGHNYSTGTAVNDSGVVVGDSFPVRGFRWESPGPMTMLSTLGGDACNALVINTSGRMVGSARDENGNVYACIWPSGGGSPVSLGTLGGNSSEADGINDYGTVVGRARNNDNRNRAFVDTGGGMVGLGTLGGSSSWANAVNNAGVVVGGSFLASGWDVAFIARPGSAMTSLGTLTGDKASEANDINDFNEVVGRSYNSGTGKNLAVHWDSLGNIASLGTLGGTASGAHGINFPGDIVGWASTGAGNHAFLHTGGVMYDLNDLVVNGTGWTLSVAYDMSDTGYIVGRGWCSGEEHAFLLVPESTTLSLLALAGAALVRRRKH